MTRGVMRTILRKRLLETTAENWSDADLNLLINEGLHQTQKEVLKVSPDEFLSVDQRDLVVATTLVTQLYDKPIGFWYERELAIKNTSTGKYTAMRMEPYWTSRDRTTGDSVYAHFGRFFFISPAPSVAVTAGLQVIYTYSIDLAADGDSPVDLHPALHIAAVMEAQLIAIGETGETGDEIRKRLNERYFDLAYYYRRSTQPGVLVPDIPKGY